MFSGILSTVVATAMNPEVMSAVLENYGPIGLAVVILYKRIDKLESRMREREERIDDLEDELAEVVDSAA